MYQFHDSSHGLLIPVVSDIRKFRVLCRPNVNFSYLQRLTHRVRRYVRGCNIAASFRLWNINIPQLIVIFRFPTQVVAGHHGLD